MENLALFRQLIELAIGAVTGWALGGRVNHAEAPSVWAAMGKMAGRDTPHPLLCHMIDTAVVSRLVAARMLGPDLLAELRAAFAPLGDPDGWIAFLCGLHDLGKYSPGFQALDVVAAERRLGEDAANDMRFVAPVRGVRRRDTPHGLVTALHMQQLLVTWGADRQTAEELAGALGGHHGFFPSSGAIRQARAEKNNHGMDKWRGWRDGLVTALAEALDLAEPARAPWRRVQLGVGAALGLAAVTTVSDWIASDESLFASPAMTTEFHAYVRVARERTDVAVSRLELEGWRAPKDSSFSAMFPGASPGSAAPIGDI